MQIDEDVILAKHLQEEEDAVFARELSITDREQEVKKAKANRSSKYKKLQTITQEELDDLVPNFYDAFDAQGNDSNLISAEDVQDGRMDYFSDEDDYNYTHHLDSYYDNMNANDITSGKLGPNSRGNPNKQVSSNKTYQPMAKVSVGKFKKRIRLDKIDYARFNIHSNAVKNKVSKQMLKVEQSRMKAKGKSDRATTEQVMDPRTRMILFKLVNNGTIFSINGCISTGKEANVYHAVGKVISTGVKEKREEFAIKVFKTSILVFKDRDKYVTGEFRFRRGYARHNPRKMVATWAEKELRNLKRLKKTGILCPLPIILRQHVLLMSFIGKKGWPAPRLKDAQLSDNDLHKCYYEVVRIMRHLKQHKYLMTKLKPNLLLQMRLKQVWTGLTKLLA